MYYKKGNIVILQAEMNRLASKDMDIISMLHTDRAAGFRMLFDAYYMPSVSTPCNLPTTLTLPRTSSSRSSYTSGKHGATCW